MNKNYLIKLKSVFILLFLCLLHDEAVAQNMLSGRVLDGNKNPLTAVTIANLTQKTGTSTDENGNFSIRSKNGDKLLFTAVGYRAQETSVSQTDHLEIIMESNDEKLDEIVVMGYGTVKRTKLTASVSTLDNKILESGMRANPAQALAGTVPGLRVSTGSGRPGAMPNIVLRGGTHWDGTGSPLILVDGQVRTSLSDINPDEIERIDVQKDAAATAIYGARASNGVILVTTKRGKTGSSSLSLKAIRGINYLNSPYEFLDAGDYVKWNRLGAVGAIKSGTLPNTTLGSPGPRGTGNKYFAADGVTPLDGNYANEARWSLMRLTDQNRFLLDQGWKTMKDVIPTNAAGNYDANGQFYDLIYEDFSYRDVAFKSPAPSQDYNLSFSGGNDKANYFSSVGLYDEKGLSLETFYKRYNFAVNADYKIKDWIKTESTINFTRANWRDQSLTNGESNYWGRMLSAPPTLRSKSPVTGDWILGRDASDGNPLVNIDKYKRRAQSDKFTLNQALVVNFLPELSLRMKGILYYEEEYHESFNQDFRTGFLSYTDPNAGWNRQRSSSASFWRDIRQTYNAVLNYNKSFGDHTVSALAGAEFYDSYYRGLGASGALAPTDDFMALGLTTNTAANPTRGASSAHTNDRIISQFGNATYDYADKYLFSATFRRDGISRLSADNRWGVFPAASVGWIATKEQFMQEKAPWLNFLKLRASWGKNGNIGIGTSNAIGVYEVQGGYSVQQAYDQSRGFLFSAAPLNELTWEKSKTTEVGMDIGLLNNKLNFSTAYYNRITSDKLAYINLPNSAGIPSIRTNNGTMRNRGIEFELGYKIIQNDKVNWTVNANAAYVRNKVIKLPYNGNDRNRQDGTQVYDPATGSLIWVGGLQEGMEWGDVYGFRMKGIIRNEADLSNYNVRDDAAGEVFYGAAAGKKVASQKIIQEQGLTGYLPTQLGDVMWEDINGDGVINMDDRVRLGNTLPKWTGGFNTTISYKGLSLFTRMDFALGHIQMDQMQMWSLGFFQGEFNATTLVNDTWTPENPNAKYPRYVWADQLNAKNFDRPSDMFWKSSNYLAFREVSLSYALPKEWLNRAKIAGLTLTVSGQNLGYITNKMNVLPERTGLQNSAYTIPTMLIMGGKITF
ncbi:SusC/RagA family TonB-linked outer membrane protein [Sphingobacterium psychroaquaticum]|uniref:SusC/RagA family TonB-linked outer membrane protein n=1 Tax=Sphingobacterium psychroaquaticum TaxID=561061 RepID=UPI00106A921D|nr:SusC/RagA family TonB-linked outer membrane protein [Sphingobacterium psychroaquaticum]QBQ40954.1 SusC/RagA family TonB-linked outer membrane protein [Sphingobacterium psychroaquaticum]